MEVQSLGKNMSESRPLLTSRNVKLDHVIKINTTDKFTVGLVSVRQYL